MKPSKTFFLFLAVLLGLVPLSCDLFCHDSCGCGKLTPTRNFVIDTMKAEITANNQAAEPGQKYSVNDLVIRIWVYEVTHASAINQLSGFSFISSAFACDPIPPGSEHYLKHIKLITNQSLSWKGMKFQTGEEVTELFRVAGFQSDPSFEFLYQYRFNFLGYESLLIRVKDFPLEETDFDVTLSLTLSDDRDFVFEDLKFRVN
ncbi:hypothetical protein [Cecembia calidifontis]|uniref:Uncharacterized protein n=1 Tax=Cecembia calidifontis TaxID=1187080 RepID=A0A4Q7PB76_9BACT|nr:hypothetical protein [Cecembia calidifontis]RZS96918.1 hypothetical protein BC751_2513 [Cecembia calidifontis]